jgi:uncharacterized membrane protein
MRLPKKQTATPAQHEFESMFDFSDITQPSKLLVGVSESPNNLTAALSAGLFRKCQLQYGAVVWVAFIAQHVAIVLPIVRIFGDVFRVQLPYL